jgi:hypothetical protein
MLKEPSAAVDEETSRRGRGSIFLVTLADSDRPKKPDLGYLPGSRDDACGLP